MSASAIPFVTARVDRLRRKFAAVILSALMLPVSGAFGQGPGGTFTEAVMAVEVLSGDTLLEVEPGRATIEAQATVRFRRNGVTATADYRIEFLLLDDAGQPVPLRTEPVSQSVLLPPVTVSSSAPGPADVYRTFEASLQPADVLESGRKYRLGVNVFHDHPTSGLLLETALIESTERTFWHFAGSGEPDDSWNILALATPYLAGPEHNPVALRNVPGQDTFNGNLQVTLRRADEWLRPAEEIPALTVETRVRLDVSLTDTTTGLPVPLTASSGGELVVPIAPFEPGNAGDGTPREPATFPQDFVPFSFTPESPESIIPTHRFRLEVTISHTNDASGTVVTGNTVVYPEIRLMSLSGRLIFGDVETEILQVGNDLTDSAVELLDGGISTSLLLPAHSARPVLVPEKTFPESLSPLLAVRYMPNGDLVVTTGAVTVSSEDTARQQGVRVRRGVITLSQAGARVSGLTVYLPAGLGFSFEAGSGRLRATHSISDVVLDGRLELPGPVVISNPGGPVYLVHERLPHRVRVSRIEWHAPSGTFLAPVQGTEYVREKEVLAAEAARPLLAVSSEADRPSNERVLRGATVTGSSLGGAGVIAVRTDARGRGLLDADLSLAPIDYESHFPAGVRIRAAGGSVAIRDSVVDSSVSVLTGAEAVSFHHSRGKVCSGGSGGSGLAFTPDGNQWRFTQDGGLAAAGTIPASNVNFGLNHSLEPVHSLLDVEEGRALIAGHVLNGDVLTSELPDGYAVHRPAAMLLSGFGSPDDAGRIERPLTAAYAEGLADYAGFNIRATGGLSAQSRIAGEALNPGGLKPHSKYYLRAGGVSGVHDAVTADIVPMPRFYGYEIELDGLRLSYLDNVNQESAIGGSVDLPAPSGFGVQLAEVTIDVYGELLAARVVNPTTRTLVYWGTPILPLSAEFAQPLEPNGCPQGGTAFLALNVRASLPSITPQPLYGRLGFKPDGTLVSAADAPGSGLDSRLTLPAEITIQASDTGRYRLTPVTRAALNRYDKANPQANPAAGFVSFAGLLDVPFFEDMKVHIHANPAGVAGNDSRLYVMGGWPNDPSRPDFGWTTGGRNFFNDPDFDSANRGWPEGISLDSYRDFRNASGGLRQEYHPVVRKVWRNVVTLDYSVQWDPARRTFTGFANPQTDLLVIEAHHELRTLSAAGCAITFGAELATPRLNVSDLVADSLANAAQRGLSRAIDGIFDLPAAAMAGRIEALEKVVSDRMAELLDDSLSRSLDQAGGVTDRVYDNLRAYYETGAVADRIDRFRNLAGDGSQLNPGGTAGLPATLRSLGEPGSEVMNAVGAGLSGALEVTNTALAFVAPGQRARVRQAVQQLAAVGGVSPGALTDLNQAMADAESAFVESEAYLRRVQRTIQDLISQMGNGTGPAAELKRALELAALDAESAVFVRLRDHFAGVHDVTGRYFDEVPEAQVKAEISRVIRESLCGSTLALHVQPVLRARFLDVRERFRSGLDLIFGEINRVLNRAVEGAVIAGVERFLELKGGDGIDTGEPSPGSGVGDFFAAARLDGYAQIHGESIREIRLNASLRMKVSDALVVDGWFRLLNTDSDTPNTSCRNPGAVATEVTVGAHGQATFGVLPVDVSLEGKFSFNSGGSLTGLDGSFDLLTNLPIRQASLDRVSFKFGFGEGEGYLSGRVGATVDFVQMEGFCFFGATRNPAALSLLDPETRDLIDAGAIGSPGADGCFPQALVGFYQGFEGAVSINAFFRIPDSCMLRLQGLMGSGNFCFLQGRSSDGTLKLIGGVRYSYGLRGEILCLVDITGKFGVAVAATVPIGDPGHLLKPDAFIGMLKNAEASGTASLRFAGKVGPCPLCVKFSKSFTLVVTMSRQGGVDIGFY